MLKDIEALLTVSESWLNNHPLLGFVVMGWFGGLIAVLRMYERVGIVFNLLSFIARCILKGLMGIFVAVLVFLSWRSTGWTIEYGWLVAGIAGVGGSDILEALVLGLLQAIRKRLGIARQAPRE